MLNDNKGRAARSRQSGQEFGNGLEVACRGGYGYDGIAIHTLLGRARFQSEASVFHSMNSGSLGINFRRNSSVRRPGSNHARASDVVLKTAAFPVLAGGRSASPRFWSFAIPCGNPATI